ncbi:MAG: M55 family metallopeptidase [Anaerolineaceae bacterium]|nr:M55 family metallopeptidase [Anaerolineaceae bacterium]
MKVYISADGEGVTGVVTPGEMYPGKPGYEFACRMMTLDVNAAIEGAFEGGASEVVVNDSHWSMNNILLELMDPRADLIRGGGKHLAMVESIQDFDAAIFVGYHARAGATDGVGNETIFGREVIEVRMNGKPVGEGELNAAVAGHFGVPVVAVTGDDAFCYEFRETFPNVEIAVVKYAINRFAARCVPPARSRTLIVDAVSRGVSEYKKHKPFASKGPVELETEFMSTAEANMASLIPGAVRKSPRVVAVSAENPPEAWKALFACQMIGATASDDIYG